VNRDSAINAIGWVATALAVGSLGVSLALRTVWSNYKHPWGYVLIGLWTLGPPVYFLLEYAFLPPVEGHHDDRVKHLHDLARNFWIAFVVVLAVLLDIPWPGAAAPHK
jgi:hypothetical protein